MLDRRAVREFLNKEFKEMELPDDISEETLVTFHLKN